MILTELVLVSNFKPSSLGIRLATMSKYHHLLFRTSKRTVIDSSLACGGVSEHTEHKYPGHDEESLFLMKYFTLADIDVMTERAIKCIGTRYDVEGIISSYLPNRPTTDWDKQLWCFEFGRVVMDGFMKFDHRPDRCVGRHWLRAIKEFKHGR